MGRQIRRVPPDWVHPTEECEGPQDFIPLYDSDYPSACKKWADAADQWYHGTHPGQQPGKYGASIPYYWDWQGNPPDENLYRTRTWTAEEAAAYQMYETVTEGTPVTPVFTTKEALVEYLVKHGDYWDQRRYPAGHSGWPRENAERFVETGFAASMMVNVASGEIKLPRDGA